MRRGDVALASPRDSLFQIGLDELFETAMGILTLEERQRVRLFVRRDALNRFVECVVCVPRDRFNTENRDRVGNILVDAFSGTQVDWTLHLSESRVVRVDYIVRCDRWGPNRLRRGRDRGSARAGHTGLDGRAARGPDR